MRMKHPALLATLLLTALPAGAQACAEPAEDSTQAYQAAVHAMHQDMQVTYTGNPDADFVRGMIPHHQGAVEMAKVVLEHGSDPEIRKLAHWIITMQEQEIGALSQWARARGYDNPTMERVYPVHASEGILKAANHAMHKAMDIDYTGNADVDFARGMIPHHQGAIDMAQAEIKYGRDPQLRALAWDIVRSQGQEIRLMQEWLKTRSS